MAIVCMACYRMAAEMIVVSLVSHGHGDLVLQSLRSLAESVKNASVTMRVLLTINFPEPQLQAGVLAHDWPFELVLIHNARPLGFGANHNQAFARSGAAQAKSAWFVVMNPDIFWPEQATDFWNDLHTAWPVDTGLVCPDQVDRAGVRQDFTRDLITPWGLAVRVFRKVSGAPPSGVASAVTQADWVNGACMVWRASAFAALNGFDERYFMYCEDTDICLRLQLAGWRMQDAGLSVVHDAQRQTGRSWRHLRWHISSLLRLWSSAAFWRYLWRTRRTAR